MAWSGWENFQMPEKPKGAASPTLEKVPTDRGSRRGAKRCIVTDDMQLIDHDVAKAGKMNGVFFQSRKEAKRYIFLAGELKAGRIRQCADYCDWRQVTFNLLTVRPDGLKQVVTTLKLDFVYERADWVEPRGVAWERVYEDVKPSGGFREDTYLLKKKFFEAQYGVRINEF